jgi:hypothetical protein
MMVRLGAWPDGSVNNHWRKMDKELLTVMQ